MCNKKERIILWGCGCYAKDILEHIAFWGDIIEVVGVVDSNREKWGTSVCGIEICDPQVIKETEFDKIIITSDKFFSEIYTTIMMEIGLADYLIENRYYFAKKKLMARYRDSEDAEKKDIVGFLQNHRLNVFNYEFADKYDCFKADIQYDQNVEMYYVMHYGKRMYMSKKLDTEEKVLLYYRSICVEQDEKSPHAYLDDEFDVTPEDVVVDMGVAEGNFALQIIDRVSKVYLIETDEDWIEALKCTFAEYQDKVVIINKFASDYVLGDVDSLDHMIDEKINFIKMDIEGSEVEALSGAKRIIKESDRIKCVVCTYHRDNDEISINALANELGLSPRPVSGYMWYPVGEKQLYISPILRRGVIKYEKRS